MSDGSGSHKNFPLISGNAATLYEKHDEISKQVNPQSMLSTTRSEPRLVMFKKLNMSGLKLTTTTPGGGPRLRPKKNDNNNNTSFMVDNGLCARPWIERSGFEACYWARHFTLTIVAVTLAFCPR